jgi:hypothetical protein
MKTSVKKKKKKNIFGDEFNYVIALERASSLLQTKW